MRAGSCKRVAIWNPERKNRVSIAYSRGARNAAGQVVRSLDLGALPKGLNTLAWDGQGERQAALPDGAYTLAVTAQQDGAALPATLLTFAGVTSVMQSGAGVALALGQGGQAMLADVRQIQ